MSFLKVFKTMNIYAFIKFNLKLGNMLTKLKNDLKKCIVFVCLHVVFRNIFKICSFVICALFIRNSTSFLYIFKHYC